MSLKCVFHQPVSYMIDRLINVILVFTQTDKSTVLNFNQNMLELLVSAMNKLMTILAPLVHRMSFCDHFLSVVRQSLRLLTFFYPSGTTHDIVMKLHTCIGLGL